MSSQLNDLRSYSRHWLGEFIELYQTEECLWQPKHPDYSNHGVRNKAYDKLVEKLKEVEPSPDRAMVVRKINSLRSAFRREFRKSNSKNNYETRLWYYDKLLFIADQHPKRLAVEQKPMKRSLGLNFDDDDSMEFETEEQLDNNVNTSHGNSDGSVQAQAVPTTETVTVTSGDCVTLVKREDHNHHHHVPQEQQLHIQQHNAVHNAQQQQHATTAVKVLEITSLDSNSQRELQQAVNSLEQQHQMQQQLQQQSGQSNGAQLTQIHQQVPTIQIAREHLPLFGSSTYSTLPATTTHNRQDDEYDAIGINVASKLRAMNPTQRIIAEKLISDVLFNAQLDNLSVHSTLTQ